VFHFTLRKMEFHAIRGVRLGQQMKQVLLLLLTKMLYNSHCIININTSALKQPCIKGLNWIVSLLSLCSWFWVLEAALCWAWHQPRGHRGGVRNWGHWPERCLFLSGKLHKYRLMMHSEHANHQPATTTSYPKSYLLLYINHGVAIYTLAVWSWH